MTYQPKSYRKFVATAATATLVASAIAPAASAATFTDVSDRYKEAVDYLVENGVAQGTAEAKFGTADSIKRVDAAVMVARLLDLEDADAPDAGFTDVPDRGQWAVNALKEAGIINGKTATSFGSQDSMTRAEMAKVIANAYELTGSEDLPFTDVSDTFEKYIKAIYEAGITQGKTDTQFGSDQDVTRGEFALFVHRAEMIVDEVVAPEVASVSAIDANKVEIQGVGLENLTAENFSLEGNKVTAYTVDEETGNATLTFESKFTSGKEFSLTLTELVDGEEVVSEWAFTYTLEVASVSALTTSVDDTENAQKLEFSINGGTAAADLAYIKASGYTVNFLSSKAVFQDSATGELDEATLVAGEKFDYQIVVEDAEGNEVAKSDLTTVEIKDYAAIVSSINDYTLELASGVEVQSAKVALSDVASITDVVGTLKSNPEVKDASLAGLVSFKSSNENVAVIDNSGNITPIQPGTVIFTVKSGDASVQVPVTIVAAARTAKTVTADVSSAKLVNDATKLVNLTVKDQYGDLYNGFDLGVLTATNVDGNTIATTTDAAATGVDGKTSFTITADSTNVGTGKVEIKNGTTVLNTVSLTIGATGTVATRNIELASGSDLNLDKIKGSTDASLVLNWNQYNKDGFLMGAETSYDTDGAAGVDTAGTYTVKSTDTDVATVSVNDTTGDITVAAGTESGSTTIQILEGDIVRASAVVTVVDSTPTISNVTFEKVDGVKSAGSVEVLKVANVTISDAKQTVALDASGVLYIEVTGAGYSSTDDITLGELDVVSNVYNGTTKNVLSVTSGSVGTIASGDEGTFVVKVTRDGEAVPVATSTYNVDVQ